MTSCARITVSGPDRVPGFAFAPLIPALLCLLALWFAPGSRASETAGWSDQFHVPWGLDGTAAAFLEVGGDLIVGGDFVAAGEIRVNHIARWDGTAWHPLGEGFNGPVSALARVGDTIIAAGGFTRSGGTAVSYIAQWDGSSWSGLGNGLDGPCFSLATTPGGLLAGGRFASAGGVAAKGVARWDGETWQSAGAGDTFAYSEVISMTAIGPKVYALWQTTPLPSDPDGVPWIMDFGLVEREGNGWSNITTLSNGGRLTPGALAVQDGALVVGGATEDILPDGRIRVTAGVFRWDGAHWSLIGDAFARGPQALAVIHGHLVASVLGSVLRFEGDAWRPIQDAPGWVSALGEYQGDLLLSGDFQQVAGVPAQNLVRWDGARWHALGHAGGAGFAPGVGAMVLTPEGPCVAGRTWTPAEYVAVCAQWDGAAWRDLPQAGGGKIAPLAVWRDTVYASGVLAPCPIDESCAGVGKWTGTEWVAAGGFTSGAVTALAPYGDALAAAGRFAGENPPARRVALWDGGRWRSLDEGLWGDISVLTAYHGNLFASGWLGVPPLPWVSVVRWNHESWEPLPQDSVLAANVRAVIGAANGLVTAADDVVWEDWGSRARRRVYRWSSAGWSQLGGDPDAIVRALAVYHGEVIAGGDFSRIGATEVHGLARWDWTAWQPFAGGVDGRVETLAVRGDSLWVGGVFRLAGEVPSRNVALWVEPRPAISGMTAGVADSLITLRWALPGAPEVVEAVVRYDKGGYPTDPNDGEPVPGGSAGRFPGSPGSSQRTVMACPPDGSSYYFSAFVRTAAGKCSRPAHARAVMRDRIAPVLSLLLERTPDSTRTLSVLLNSSESLDSSKLEIRTGEGPLALARRSWSGRRWAAGLNLTGMTGEVLVTAQATDSAGNLGRCGRSFLALAASAAAGATLGGRDFALELPPQALAQDEILTMIPLDFLPPGGGRLFRVQPVLSLMAEAVVSIAYTEDDLAGGPPDQLYISEDGSALPSYVDADRHLVSATTRRLGLFEVRRGESGASQPVDPSFLRLESAGANPFRESARIHLRLLWPQTVAVDFFDVLGRRVRTLPERRLLYGTTEISWDGRLDDGREAPAGLYFCSVRGQQSRAVLRLLRIR